jgi:predicted nucleotidyltransferase
MTFEAFIEEIKRLYKPEQLILFGSRAQGVPKEGKESSYDILIVSNAFKGIPYTDRMTPIFKLWEMEEDLGCFCLTPLEFELLKGKISLIAKIIKEGVPL